MFQRFLWLVCALLLVFSAQVDAAPHRWTPTYGSPFGINAHTVIWDGNTKAVNAIKNAGIGWVRVDFNWVSMEPQKGKYDWKVSDGIVKVAVANQFNLFATLAYAPAWASAYQPPSGKRSGPKNGADYERFVEAVVKRYKGKISHWGIWNEPNLDHFLWFPSGVKVAQKRSFYINNIVIPGIRAVRRADPDAVIVIGDMAHLGQSKIPAKDHSWQPWLENLLKTQGSKFDVIAHHTYQDDYMRTLNGTVWPWEFPSVWSTIQSAGLTKKPFWMTEIGWKTNEVSEAKQAAEYKKMLDTMLGLTKAKGKLWWSKVFPYELVDDPNIKEKWGITKSDFTPKAAWNAYRDYIRSHQPVARIKSPVVIQAGMTVTFSGSGSSDPDGSLQKYSWDFDFRDGVKEDKQGKNVTHSFSKPGTYKVTLTVTDNHEISNSTQVSVLVKKGSGPPVNPSYDVVQAPASVKVDGVLGEWSKAKGVVLGANDYVKLTGNYGGTSDLSAIGYWMWSSKGLYFAARVTDQTHSNTFSLGNLWQGDSIQLAIDADNDRSGPSFDQDGDYEWGIALANGKVSSERTHAPTGASKVNIELAIKRSGTTTTYEMFLPASGLKPLRFAAGQKFSLNFLVNDNDNSGRKGWLHWTPGIGKSKDPSQYTEATLKAGSSPPVEPPPVGESPSQQEPPPQNEPSSTGDSGSNQEAPASGEAKSPDTQTPSPDRSLTDQQGSSGTETTNSDASTIDGQASKDGTTSGGGKQGQSGCNCDSHNSPFSLWLCMLLVLLWLLRRRSLKEASS